MTEGNHHAYPVSATAAQRIIEGYGFEAEYLGMTKRELFASIALPAIVAARIKGFGYKADPTYKGHETRLVTSPQLLAQGAVRLADALIAELNEK